MRTHAVKGLVKCIEHDTYIIKCGCPAPDINTARRRFKRLGIQTEPAKELWLGYVTK